MKTFIIIDGWIRAIYVIERCCIVVICLIVVLIAETQSRQHQLLGGKVGPDKSSDPNLAFDWFSGLLGHLLQYSCKLCVVVVFEVEPVGEVEQVEGRGQEQEERRGVHSASGGCRLEAREATTSAGGGGGGGGGEAKGRRKSNW